MNPIACACPALADCTFLELVHTCQIMLRHERQDIDVEVLIKLVPHLESEIRSKLPVNKKLDLSVLTSIADAEALDAMAVESVAETVPQPVTSHQRTKFERAATERRKANRPSDVRFRRTIKMKFAAVAMGTVLAWAAIFSFHHKLAAATNNPVQLQPDLVLTNVIPATEGSGMPEATAVESNQAPVQPKAKAEPSKPKTTMAIESNNDEPESGEPLTVSKKVAASTRQASTPEISTLQTEIEELTALRKTGRLRKTEQLQLGEVPATAVEQLERMEK